MKTKWELEFDKEFVVHCSDGDILGKDTENEVKKAKSFIRQTIASEIKEFAEEIGELPRIEITYKDGSKSRAILEHSLNMLISLKTRSEK